MQPTPGANPGELRLPAGDAPSGTPPANPGALGQPSGPLGQPKGFEVRVDPSASAEGGTDVTPGGKGGGKGDKGGKGQATGR